MKKILVIEDEESVRENLRDLLEVEDFDAISAPDGLIGIQLAREHLPDLILCDVMMPKLDGYGVLKQLRQDPRTATIPFIFLTALADRSNLRLGMDLGADDYLPKPFTPAELFTAIRTRLEKQASAQQRSQEQLDELRSSISLSLPHELQTPLNAILGYSDVLLDEYESLDAAEVREMLQEIQNSGQGLHRLIRNFLLYAKLELWAREPERIQALRAEQTECCEIVIRDQAIRKAQQVDREADLHLDLLEANVQIAADRLNKLVEELMDNAFKFSTAGTPVRVTSTVQNHQFILSISNQGRGMTAEQIAQVSAYRQFERKLYEQQGTGLGLAIAKRLAELHGGELTIQSLADQHTTVQVMLPAEEVGGNGSGDD